MAALNFSFKSSGGSANWSGWTQTPTSPATETLNAGVPQTSISGKNKSAANNVFTLTGTWESLFGVPAGSTITGVTSASLQSKCTAFTTGGSTHTSNAATLVDGATTITLAASRSFTAVEGAFVTSSGTDATGLSLASSDSITLTIGNSLSTGNSNSAVMTLQQNNLLLTVNYLGPDRYAVGTGTWDGTNTAIWSDSSGGTTGAPVPTSANNVFFDTNSGTVTVGADVNCKNLDFTGFTGAFGDDGVNRIINVYGDTILAAAMTLSYAASWQFQALSGVQKFTSAGISAPNAVPFGSIVAGPNSASTATFQPQDALTFCADVGLTVVNGVTFDVNGFDCSVASFNLKSSAVLALGTTTLSVASNFGTSDGTGSITGAGIVKITGTGAPVASLDGMTIAGTLELVAPFQVNLNGTCTISTLKIDGGQNFLFESGKTFTVDALDMPASSGNGFTIDSDDGVNPFTLSCASGTIQAFGCTISNSAAAGGATFEAFTSDGNVDGGGNTGWLFAAPVLLSAILRGMTSSRASIQRTAFLLNRVGSINKFKSSVACACPLISTLKSRAYIRSSLTGSLLFMGHMAATTSVRAASGLAAVLVGGVISRHSAKSSSQGGASISGMVQSAFRTAFAITGSRLLTAAVRSSRRSFASAIAISAITARVRSAAQQTALSRASTSIFGAIQVGSKLRGQPKALAALASAIRVTGAVAGTASGLSLLMGKVLAHSSMRGIGASITFLIGSIRSKQNIMGPVAGVAGLSVNVLTLSRATAYSSGIVSLSGSIRLGYSSFGSMGQRIINLIPIPRYIRTFFKPFTYVTSFVDEPIYMSRMMIKDLSYITNTDASNMPQATPLPPIDALRQDQTITLDFGAGNYLPAGVTLNGVPTVEISVLAGDDPNPQSRITGGPVIGTAPAPYGSGRANCAVLVQIGDCPSTAIRYLIECECDLTNGDVATMDVELPVRNPPN